MRTKWYEHKMYPLSFLFINFVSCCISSFEKKKQYSIHFIFPVILLNEDFWSSFCSGIVFSLDMILLHIKIIFLNAFGFLNYNSTCAFIKSIYIYMPDCIWLIFHFNTIWNSLWAHHFTIYNPIQNIAPSLIYLNLNVWV